jgi:hypothetical protein
MLTGLVLVLAFGLSGAGSRPAAVRFFGGPRAQTSKAEPSMAFAAILSKT